MLNAFVDSTLLSDQAEVAAQNFYFSLQDSLPEKLAVHEKNVKEFDAFVETLQ